jgi:hypothetical protein
LELKDELPSLSEEDLEEIEDAPDSETEVIEEKFIDQATAARTIAELKAEIGILKELEEFALRVRRSGTDKKWEELSRLLQENAEMFDESGSRRKLIIFTEHRDTLNYLADRIKGLLGVPDAITIIHGSMGREDRKKAEETFKQDKTVQILVATDAAGEGINLQRSHLMVNYDLPWNPNRIEQRFGRIHRIGQTEVCHLWNLVAEETREGDVYLTLLRKLEAERGALGGAVFDVLGKAIGGTELRKLLIEAIRYGNQPEVRARLTQQVEKALDRDRLKELLEERFLAHESMDSTRVREIREEMERIEARRLQPHFICSFFLEAFKLLGGSIQEREPKRFEIKHVPAVIRNRDRLIGYGEPVLPRYERICFEKELINPPGKPLAAFVCPGHPLLDAVIDLTLERYRTLLKQGAIFADDSDPEEDIKALFYLEHSIQDARTDRNGQRRVVSRQVQFVKIDERGNPRNAGHAPYLDYRPLTPEEQSLVQNLLVEKEFRNDLETKANTYAITSIVPKHFQEVKKRKEEIITRIIAAVKGRLTKEINYWDHRAEELKAQELAGKINAKINSGKARARADELEARLQKRLAELEEERQLSPLPPVIIGGALIIPKGLLDRLKGERKEVPETFSRETRRVEQMAMQAVMAAEQALNYVPRDVSCENCGYDIESSIPGTGKLRFIEVKGRVKGASTVTITKNEILTAFNKPDDFILALVEVDIERTIPRYIRRPFQREPDFGVTSVNYDLSEMLARSEDPA